MAVTGFNFLLAGVKLAPFMTGAPKTAFGSSKPAHGIQHLGMDYKPLWSRDPTSHAYVVSKRQNPDSGRGLALPPHWTYRHLVLHV